jgi:hypothetical protein
VVGSGDVDEDYQGRKYGFVDKTGKISVNPQFSDANPFYESLAKVTLGYGTNRKTGFIS